jgi:hydrogenase expression/formation protein HypE
VAKKTNAIEQSSCPVPVAPKDTITLGHGSGGRLSAELVRDIFLPAFQNPALSRLDDQAIVSIEGTRIAISTDSFVVKPLFFPGGDIGSLAVHGTINDLAMGGAQPLYLTVGFILEEGLPTRVLRRIVESMRDAAQRAGVQVITGDTKVVERGSGDDVFINTTGIGLVTPGVELSADRARPGDKVILSGYVGDHGIAILAQREGLEFDSTIASDSAPLHTVVAEMLSVAGDIRCMRDPTRGGLSSALNEIAGQSRVGIEVLESTVPLREEVRGACELLGLDPFYVANEGKLIAIVGPDSAEKLVAAMRRHPLGQEARMIGEVTREHAGIVTVRTTLGTTRLLDMLPGDQLPRIC